MADQGMKFTNVGLRVAELGKRPTRVPDSGGCSGLLKDVMLPTKPRALLYE